MALHPRVDVRLREQISTAIANSVAENAADIGIPGTMATTATGWPCCLYRTDELVLVIPSEHPLARRRAVKLREALAYDFVGAHPGSAIGNQLTQAAASRAAAEAASRSPATTHCASR